MRKYIIPILLAIIATLFFICCKKQETDVAVGEKAEAQETRQDDRLIDQDSGYYSYVVEHEYEPRSAEYEDALRDGWPLAAVAYSGDGREIFVLPFVGILGGNEAIFNNPGDKLYGKKPYSIHTVDTHYKNRGRDIENRFEEMFFYSPNRSISYRDSDGSAYFYEAFIDNYGRPTTSSVTRNNTLVSNTKYVYDPNTGHRFEFEDGSLKSVVSEEVFGNTIIYNEYTNKRLAVIHKLTVDDLGEVSNIVISLVLHGTPLISTTTFEYISGRIIRAEDFSHSINKIVFDVTYFYEGGNLIRTVSESENNEILYSNHDHEGNWLKMTVAYGGFISSIHERAINYDISEEEFIRGYTEWVTQREMQATEGGSNFEQERDAR